MQSLEQGAAALAHGAVRFATGPFPPNATDHDPRPAFRTLAVHVGEDESAPVRPLTEPVHHGVVYAFRDPSLVGVTLDAEAAYSRDGLPNIRSLERAVAELEGAEAAHAVASGMAAIALVFLAHLSAGDHVVVSADCYGETARLLTEELVRFGIGATFVDACDPETVRDAITLKTALLYVETISNPAMKLADLPRLAALAEDYGLLLCVDNTFATPALCRPITHGADLVLHSATKFLGGHHDLTAGVVAGRRDLVARIRRAAVLYGPTLAPLDAWLALRGIRTLAPRIAWMSETAATVAAFLQDHPAVACVRYPGLPDHPQADLVRRLLPDGAGAMLAFDLHGGPCATEAAIRRLRMIPYALSLGGTTTTVCYARSQPSADSEPEDRPGLHGSATIRMSVGLEAARDVIADLSQALDGLAQAPAARVWTEVPA